MSKHTNDDAQKNETFASKATKHCGCRASGPCHCGESCACNGCPCQRGTCGSR